jgi:hypothetical protein
MFDRINSLLRSFVATVIAAGTLVSLAAGLALATAGTASADEYSMKFTVYMKDEDAKKTPLMYCPPPYYYLENKTYSAGAGWVVPNGVELTDAAGINPYLEVRKFKITNDSSWQTWAFGVNGNLTNTNPDRRAVNIILHCSTDPKDGYHPGS